MIKVGKRKCKIRRLKCKRTPNPPPPWVELPADVTANILHRLGAVEILETAQKVCTNWRKVCKDPSMWRVIDMTNLGDIHAMPYDLEVMCRHAVDRSQGQLIDINIPHFGTDELLFYIDERCSNLKRISLAYCYDISTEGLAEAAKKFPELEELHLFYLKNVDDEGIESVGNSCPKLKSFTYNQQGYKNSKFTDEESNGYALAVAKSMPNLRHLRLFGDLMWNKGLEAILNSCLHLESLDLRQCFSLDLSGDLGKRCSKQIRNLRLPNDSTDDYEWDSSFYDGHHLDDYYGYDSSGLSYGSYDLSDYGIDYDDYYDSDDFDPDNYFPMGSP